MEYDLKHNGFSSFEVFLRYCEGAAIAPASVFVHLCGSKKPADEYIPPTFDIHDAAKGLAVFSYLVHILRDFQKDQLRNLNYFADDILEKCELTSTQLRDIVAHGEIDWRIIQLYAEYKSIAAKYQKEARGTFDRILPRMGQRYQLSMQVIYGLYSHLYEKIDPKNRSYSETDLNLSPDEVKNRIDLTVKSFKPL
jgi:phytoene/squalene synthetase